MMLRWLVSNWVREAAVHKVQEAVTEAVHQQPLAAGESRDNPPPSCDIAIIFALAVESGGTVDLLDHCVTTKCQAHVEHVGVFGDRQVVVAEAGVGREAADMATRQVVDVHHPRWIISAGFAGALEPALRRGHILMADEVAVPGGQVLSVGLKASQKDAEQSPSLHYGRLLTVDRLVRTRSEKEQLAAAHGALACDMESMAVAEVCQQAEIPFLSVRIISDGLEEELPREIETLVEQSTLAGKLGAATGAIFKRPSSVKDMWKLKEDALKASDRLARFLRSVVMQLTPE